MLEFSAVINRKLYTFTGFGASNCSRADGRFIVRNESEEKEFETLVKAWKYYSSIDADVELIDATHSEPVLIEKKEVLPLPDKF